MKKMKSAMALICLPALSLPAMAANTKICFEAEKPASISAPLKKVASGASADYSGNGFLEIPWNGNKDKGKGQAGFKFTAKKAGVYTLWARTYWAQGCGNSISVSVNGDAPATIGEDGQYGSWHWLRGPRVQVKAGANVLVMKNREEGIKVDQFFLCTDPNYVPTGIRKVTK